MTQEEKELLLKDLCVRLPYQPICKKIDTKDDFCECDGPLGYSLRDFVGNKITIKPYLRSMSSMTSVEEDFYYSCLDEMDGYKQTFPVIYQDKALSLLDWLNVHHFDYRGLIEKGLALEAPEGMYKTE